jgi:kumamolisin
VGGTSLTLSVNGGVATESGWASSGGGISIFFDRPAWQTGNGVPAGKKRLFPDVSLAADPNEGAFLVLQGKTQQSAPVWAGFCALLNEGRAKAKKPFLPFLNPLIYPLMGTTCFRDVSSGEQWSLHGRRRLRLSSRHWSAHVRELLHALAPNAQSSNVSKAASKPNEKDRRG